MKASMQQISTLQLSACKAHAHGNHLHGLLLAFTRERKIQEKFKDQRRERQNKLNRENKMKQWEKQSEERKRAQRRHISEKRNEVEDFIRLRNSASRFYGDTTSATRCKQIVSEGFVSTKKTSSVLGWGRGDLKSNGTSDAFAGLPVASAADAKE